MVYKRLNNSVFIINIITVFYLFTFQVVNPLKRRIVYPYKLFRSLISSVKEAYVTISNLFFPPNLSLNIRVLNK